MNYASIRRKLDVMEGKRTGELLLIVTLPDGTQAKKTPQQWWDNRHIWQWDFLKGIACYDPNGWPPFLLFHAKGLDDAYQEAMKNGGSYTYKETTIGNKGEFITVEKHIDASYYKEERDDCLRKFNIKEMDHV